MNFRYIRNGHRGFSLIEVLVAVLIIGIGLVGLVSLQTNIMSTSSESKARAEAIAIAQSRIEQLRNYTHQIKSQQEFNLAFAPTTEPVNKTQISGVTTDFTRVESRAAAGETTQVTVQVSWSDSKGQAQQASLSSQLSFQSPRSGADMAKKTKLKTGSPSATGRASLGKGKVPSGQTLIRNDDGTAYFDVDGDRKLVVGDDVVLTLEGACNKNTKECTDFVRTAGTVYIDTATQSQLKLGDVYVIGSDATYCHRWYTDSKGKQQNVVASTTSAMQTPNGDYKFFYYTCYLGGGWHGNIGIMLNGGLSQNDKICMGDPTAANAFEKPVISARRVYRGMLYKHDKTTASGKQEYISANGQRMVRYYSVGIKDGVTLPGKHHFVVAKLPPSKTAGSFCESDGIMLRKDATVNGKAGALFAEVKTAFVCLNPDFIDQSFDKNVYGVEKNCPYDPSDPPSSRHLITGAVNIIADEKFGITIPTIDVITSDGANNCRLGEWRYSSNLWANSYSCDVYDWGKGWTGSIQVSGDQTKFSCNPKQINFNQLTGSRSGNNFNCESGSRVVIKGSISTSGAKNLTITKVVISDTGGHCQLATDGSSYTCSSGVLNTATWTGALTFTANGVICQTTNGVFNFTNVAPGIITQNVEIATNLKKCTTP